MSKDNILQFPRLPEHIEREAIREGEEELAAWRRHRERQRRPHKHAKPPLSYADHQLVLQVMVHHGWSYDEARERLEWSGM